jgi:hypothetical protein
MKTSMMILVGALVGTLEVTNEKKRPLENYVLTDERIAQAIEDGLEEKGGVTGLRLSLAPRLRGDPNPDDSTMFSIEVYTPYSWVSQQASWAAKRYKTFTRDDVTEAMVDGVLRVFAHPDMPTVAADINRARTSGVKNVIVRSTAKKNFEILRPIGVEEGVEYAYTRAGKEVAYTSKSAVFDLQRVAEIAKLDENGEFFVVVIGTKYNGSFKIKTKHFEKLP